MLAALAVAQDPHDPLAGLEVRDVPDPEAPDGWAPVRVAASSLNLHDVWTLRGVGHPAERLPMILGCEAAGMTADGRRVMVHPVFGSAERGHGDETFDPQRSILSEIHQGGLAEIVVVPEANIVPIPDWLSFADAASIGVAWATAYRMLFTRARVSAGDTVLVQGALGGVASAAIAIAAAAGVRVWATSRSEEGRAFAFELGAESVFEPGARLPERVDVVIETVGKATWAHSLKSLRPGGVVVIAGATSGPDAAADLARVFYQQLSVVGSTMSTRGELESLIEFLGRTGVRPRIDRVVPLERVREGFEALIAGGVRGKIVVEPT